MYIHYDVYSAILDANFLQFFDVALSEINVRSGVAKLLRVVFHVFLSYLNLQEDGQGL